MHLKLEDFNLLLEGKISSLERKSFVDHIVSCKKCTMDFKMLHELKTEVQGTEKKSSRLGYFKYGLGAAAVLFLSAWPYFQSDHPLEDQPATVEFTRTASNVSLQVIDEVRKVNQDQKWVGWGDSYTIQDIIKKS